VEGNASSEAINESASWQLWIGVIAMAMSTAPPELQMRIKAAVADGYLSVTRFWTKNFQSLINLLGFRIRHPWSMDHFSTAAIAYAEGCALRQVASGEIEMVVRDTGPKGEGQEWSPYATGMEALVDQFLEPDPGFTPSSGGAEPQGE